MFPPAGVGGVDFAIHILKLSCLTSSLDTSGDLGGVTHPHPSQGVLGWKNSCDLRVCRENRSLTNS